MKTQYLHLSKNSLTESRGTPTVVLLLHGLRYSLTGVQSPPKPLACSDRNGKPCLFALPLFHTSVGWKNRGERKKKSWRKKKKSKIARWVDSCENYQYLRPDLFWEFFQTMYDVNEIKPWKNSWWKSKAFNSMVHTGLLTFYSRSFPGLLNNIQPLYCALYFLYCDQRSHRRLQIQLPFWSFKFIVEEISRLKQQIHGSVCTEGGLHNAFQEPY